MIQLQLFDLADNFNVRCEWKPLFEPHIMDRLANIRAMGWRNEIKRRNHELQYKQPDNQEIHLTEKCK